MPSLGITMVQAIVDREGHWRRIRRRSSRCQSDATEPGTLSNEANRHRHGEPGIVAADRERHAPRLVSTMVALVLNLAAERGKVAQRLDTRKEEVATALYGRESGQALYLSSDRTLRDRQIVGAVLSADHRIAFIAQLVEIWVVDPDVLREFELAHETCADHECGNAAIDPSSGAPSGRGGPYVAPRRIHFATLDIYGRVTWVHPPNMGAQRDGVTLGIHLCVVEVVVALRVVGERRIVFVRRKHKGSAASPAAHQFCCKQLLVICGRPALLAQKVAKGDHVLL